MTNHRSTEKTATYIGAGIAFVLFLVFGALPGLLFGGYLGLTMGNALFGLHGEVGLVARLMTGGGMMLGFVAALALFLVAGSVLGAATGAALDAATRESPAPNPVPEPTKH